MVLNNNQCIRIKETSVYCYFNGFYCIKSKSKSNNVFLVPQACCFCDGLPPVSVHLMHDGLLHSQLANPALRGRGRLLIGPAPALFSRSGIDQVRLG